MWLSFSTNHTPRSRHSMHLANFDVYRQWYYILRYHSPTYGILLKRSRDIIFLNRTVFFTGNSRSITLAAQCRQKKREKRTTHTYNMRHSLLDLISFFLSFFLFTRIKVCQREMKHTLSYINHELAKTVVFSSSRTSLQNPAVLIPAENHQRLK